MINLFSTSAGELLVSWSIRWRCARTHIPQKKNPGTEPWHHIRRICGINFAHESFTLTLGMSNHWYHVARLTRILSSRTRFGDNVETASGLDERLRNSSTTTTIFRNHAIPADDLWSRSARKDHKVVEEAHRQRNRSANQCQDELARLVAKILTTRDFPLRYTQEVRTKENETSHTSSRRWLQEDPSDKREIWWSSTHYQSCETDDLAADSRWTVRTPPRTDVERTISWERHDRRSCDTVNTKIRTLRYELQGGLSRSSSRHTDVSCPAQCSIKQLTSPWTNWNQSNKENARDT